MVVLMESHLLQRVSGEKRTDLVRVNQQANSIPNSLKGKKIDSLERDLLEIDLLERDLRNGDGDWNDGPLFNDLGGMDAVLEELKMLPLYHPQVTRHLGVRPMSYNLIHCFRLLEKSNNMNPIILL